MTCLFWRIYMTVQMQGRNTKDKGESESLVACGIFSVMRNHHHFACCLLSPDVD